MKKEMKREVRRNFIITGILLLLFILLIIAVLAIDVRPIGPSDSSVGLATINKCMFEFLGVHIIWYHITDWLGVVAIAVAFIFALLGLVQLIRRKRIQLVDTNILALGVFYAVVILAYAFFELVVVNYRPILIEGNSGLEASFPSSHTMIVLCIMATAIMQFPYYIKNSSVRLWANIASIGIVAVTIIGRLISGVHWFTDVLGGVLLGSGFIMLYYAVMHTTAFLPEKDVDDNIEDTPEQSM